MSKLLDNLDIVVFGATVVVVGLVLAMGWGTARADALQAIEAATKARGDLETALEVDRYRDEEGARVLDSLADFPDRVKKQWEPPRTAVPSGAGLFYHRSAVEELRNGVDPEIRFLPPTDLEAKAEIGSVMLRWNENENASVVVTGYTIYRRKDKTTDRRKIASLDANSFEYVDRDVQAGTLYFYDVTALTTDPVLLVDEVNESDPTRPVHVRGLTDYEIKSKNWDEAAKRLRVVVRKYSRGVWHEKDFDAVVGQVVGRRDDGSGVDFATGCVVLDIANREEIVRETVREVRLAADGRVLLGDDGRPELDDVEYERPFRVIVLTVKDRLGRTSTFELRRPL